MDLKIAQDVAALSRMTVAELRIKHMEAFGEPTRTHNKEYLVKRVAWRLQANAYGDLSEQAKRRAEELANDADLRTTVPKAFKTENWPELTRRASITFNKDARVPMVGSNIRRTYRGREVIVRVLPKGFEHEGKVYRTLSAVAKAVTGTHWNGYHFFNLQRKRNNNE